MKREPVQPARASKRFFAGCLLVLLLAGLGAAAVYAKARRVNTRAKSRAVAALQAIQIPRHLDAPDVSALASLRETGSAQAAGVLGSFLCVATLDMVLADAAVDDAERLRINVVTEFLNQHPAPSPEDLGAFLEEHPSIEAAFQAWAAKQPEHWLAP